MDTATSRDAWAIIKPSGPGGYEVTIHTDEGKVSAAVGFHNYRRAERYAKERVAIERRRMEHEAGKWVTVR